MMMNRLYIDQVTRAINSGRLKYQNYYDDQAMATGALEWFVEYLESALGNCLNVSDGVCDTWWRHDDCFRLMGLLFDLTSSERYVPGNFLDDPAKFFSKNS